MDGWMDGWKVRKKRKMRKEMVSCLRLNTYFLFLKEGKKQTERQTQTDRKIEICTISSHIKVLILAIVGIIPVVFLFFLVFLFSFLFHVTILSLLFRVWLVFICVIYSSSFSKLKACMNGFIKCYGVLFVNLWTLKGD